MRVTGPRPDNLTLAHREGWRRFAEAPDGAVVSAGSNASGQCDVSSCSGVRVP